MQLSDYESQKSVSNMADSVESGEISSSSFELDKLFVTCLNHDSKHKSEKPIKNYLDLLINTCLNHISIRSHLVSQPCNKFISNSEQLFNAMDLLPMILPLNPRGKNSTNSQMNQGTLDENNKSKQRTITCYWIAVLEHQFDARTYHTNVTKFLKIKRINNLFYYEPLILLS